MLKTVNWGFVMYKKDLYNKKTEYDNMTYSVDKIRLKTNITYVQFICPNNSIFRLLPKSEIT